jgi:integrase
MAGTWKPKTLTDAALKAIKPPAQGRLVVRDPTVTGLVLRVSPPSERHPAGRRAWSLEVKAPDGRQLRITLGAYPEIGLAEARRRAGRMRADVRDGADPTAAKRARRATEAAKRKGVAGAATLRELLDSFERLKAKPAGLRSWADMRQMIEHNFVDFLSKALPDLTRGDFRAVLDAAVTLGAPISGKRAARYLARVFGWAVERELVPANPAAGLALDELTRPERVRQRVLNDDEIRAVWRAATEAGAPFGDLARFYLLTGLRRDEAAALRWADLDGGTLVLGATKTDEPHRLPLSTAALAIVKAQPERGPFVFTLRTGAAAAGRHTNWHRENTKLVARASTAPWTWHDLRRTARTLLARIGVDDLVAELILNHALPGKLRRTYNLHRYQDEMRAALERLAAVVEQIVAGEANVVNLRRTAG